MIGMGRETRLVGRCPVCGAESSMQTCMNGLMGDLRTETLGCEHAVQVRFNTFFSQLVCNTDAGVEIVPMEVSA